MIFLGLCLAANKQGFITVLSSANCKFLLHFRLHSYYPCPAEHPPVRALADPSSENDLSDFEREKISGPLLTNR